MLSFPYGLNLSIFHSPPSSSPFVYLNRSCNRLSLPCQNSTISGTTLIPPQNPGTGILSSPSNNIPSSGADIVIDASGASLSIRTALHVLRTGGTYVQGGMGASSIDAFPIMALCTKEVTVKGSFRYSAGDFELAVGLIADGRVGARDLVTGKVPFLEAERAYEEVREGKGVKWLIEGVRDS